MRQIMTRKRMRWFGVTVLVSATLYSVITLTPWSIGICGENDLGGIYSPDDKFFAKAFVRGCGATTGFLTHVNLRSRWRWFNPNWVGAIEDGQVFANSCWSKVNLVWKDNSNLEIQYWRCDLPNRNGDPAWMKESSWKGINISYREVSPPIDNK